MVVLPSQHGCAFNYSSSFPLVSFKADQHGKNKNKKNGTPPGKAEAEAEAPRSSKDSSPSRRPPWMQELPKRVPRVFHVRFHVRPSRNGRRCGESVVPLWVKRRKDYEKRTRGKNRRKKRRNPQAHPKRFLESGSTLDRKVLTGGSWLKNKMAWEMESKINIFA